jgi:two-component system, sensor histidine kinase and response regulator
MKIKIIFLFIFIIYSRLLIAGKPDAIDSLVTLLSKTKSDSTKAEILCEIAKSYARIQNSEKSLEYANKALDISLISNNNNAAAKAYNIKGNLYGLLADNSEMLDNFLKAEQHYLKTQNKKGLSETYLNIAGVHHRRGKDSTALSYMAKSRKIAEEMSDSLSIAMLINAEAVIYSAAGAYNKALQKLFEAGAIMEKMAFTHGLLNIYLSLGLTYLDLDDAKNAETYCIKCFETANTSNNTQYMTGALACIIQSKLKLNPKDAASDVNRLIQLSEFATELTIKTEAYAVIKKYYDKIGDYKNALKFSTLHQESTDSLYAAEKAKQSERINTIIRLQEKEKESQILAANEAQKDAVIHQQSITVYITLSAIILISVLLLFQYRSNRKLKKAYRELDIKKEALISLNTTKDQLFAIVSHDLMSPVIALHNIIELLKLNALSQDELSGYLTEASVEVENTTDFLRNLLIWAKSSMDGFKIKKENLNIKSLSENAIAHLRPQLERKKIELVNNIENHYWVTADKDLLETVFRNLVSNALKFSARGGIIIIDAKEEANSLRISVRDKGNGIPETIQKNIFSDILSSSVGTENEKGSGIGLNLCKKFVTANGGNIGFNSKEKEGSEFWFTVGLSFDK